MTGRDLAADLAFALDVADRVDGFTLPAFRRADFTLGWKDDRTEVTQVDRGAETLIAEAIATERPGDAIFGEEHGLAGNRDSPWRWVIDPIDGTSGFVRGIPVWASLIALTVRSDAGDGPGRWSPVVAVVTAPAIDRRWWAARGLGSFANGTSIGVSDVSAIGDAQANVTLNRGWADLGKTEALTTLMIEARRSRGVGDFWQHCLVAEGAIDVAIDAIGVQSYDLAAARLVVEEAGGRFTDRHGVATHESDSAISSNGTAIHDEVLARLA